MCRVTDANYTFRRWPSCTPRREVGTPCPTLGCVHNPSYPLSTSVAAFLELGVGVVPFAGSWIVVDPKGFIPSTFLRLFFDTLRAKMNELESESRSVSYWRYSGVPSCVTQKQNNDCFTLRSFPYFVRFTFTRLSISITNGAWFIPHQFQTYIPSTLFACV